MRKKHRSPSGQTSGARKKLSRRPRLEPLEARMLMSADPVTAQHGPGCSCPACSARQDAYGTLQMDNSPAAIAADLGLTSSDIVAAGSSGSGAVAAAGVKHALSSIPALNSLPGAKATLYLDFDGHYEASWGAYSGITTPAFDQDGDATTFTDNELATINQIWRQVAEDYAPFDINVTTVQPPSFADKVALRVVIGGDGAWIGPYGGVSYVNSFTNSSLVNTSFVFSKNLANGTARYTGEAVSHEAGHAFGLDHQSQYSGTGSKLAEYYMGTSDRAPIMGNSYYAARGLWWSGTPSSSSTALQDDMTIISRSANGFGYRADDYGGTANTAANLSVQNGSVNLTGVITQTTDTDWFKFSTSGGQVGFSVYTASGVNDLDSRLELRDASGTLITSNDTGDSFDASLSLTLGAGTYYAVVGSHGSYGDIGQYTLMGTITAAGVVPVAPTGLTATAASSSQINLTWTDNSSNESGFLIEQSTDGTNWSQIATTPGNTTSYQVTGLTSGTNYSFRVRATASGINSSYSNVGSASTIALPPTAPGNLTATAVSASQINLSWTDLSNNETGFRVERSTDGTNWTQIATTGANATSYQVTGLGASSTYYFRVRAVNSTQSSAYTSTASATTLTAPPVPQTPTNVTATANGTKQVIVRWNDNSSNELGFYVQRSANGGGWITIANVGANTTSYTDTSVARSNWYSYRIIAYNTAGASAPSLYPTLQTPSAPARLVSPTNLTATALGGGRVALSWNDTNSGEYGYKVQRSSNRGRTWTTINVTAQNVTSFTDYSAGRNNSFIYRIAAFNDGSTVPLSNRANVRTPSYAALPGQDGAGVQTTIVERPAAPALAADEADRVIGHWNVPASFAAVPAGIAARAALSPAPQVIFANETFTQVFTADYTGGGTSETSLAGVGAAASDDFDLFRQATDDALSKLHLWM